MRNPKDVKKYVDYRKRYKNRPQFAFNPEFWCYVWDWVNHRKLKPSTGLAGVVLALRICSGGVDLYGFSHSAEEFHYFNHLPPKVTQKEVYEYHPLLEEAAIYRELDEIGNVKNIE